MTKTTSIIVPHTFGHNPSGHFGIGVLYIGHNKEFFSNPIVVIELSPTKKSSWLWSNR